MDNQENNPLTQTDNSPQRPRFRFNLGFKRIAITLLIVLTTLAASGYWLLNTASGLHWSLTTAARMSDDKLRIEGIQGTFHAMQIDQLHFQEETLRLVIEQLQLDWSIRQVLAGKLQINTISAQSVHVHTAPSAPEDEEEALALPESLTLPIDISLKNLSVDEINLYTIDETQSEPQPDFTLTDLTIGLDSNGQRHQLTQLTFHSILGALKVNGQIQTEPPFNLETRIRLDNTGWGATQAALTGTLEHIDLKLAHNKAPMQGKIAAQLRPFEQNPLAILTHLDVSIQAFDPAAFFPDDAPHADIALQTRLRRNNNNQLAGKLALVNNTAQTLDQNGLPLKSVRTDILLSDDALNLQALQIALTQESSIAGDIAWQLAEETGQAKLNVKNLNPAVIDTQLQAANINGLIEFTGGADQQQIDIHLSDPDLGLKLDASVSHKDNQISLKHVNLNHGISSLAGHGALHLDDADHPNDMNATGTPEKSQPFHFSGQLKQFNIADFIKAPQSNLNTQLAIAGHLSPEFSGTLDYTFEKSHLNRQPVSGKGQIAFTAPLSIASKTYFQIGANHLKIEGKFGQPGDALALNLNAPALEQIGLGLSGYLKTQIDLKGTLDAPAVDFVIDSDKLVLPGDQSIDHLAANGKIHQETLALTLTANQYRADGKTQLKQLDLKLTGTKSAHTLQTDLRIDDDMAVTLQAEGGLLGLDQANADPGWQGLLSHLSVSGPLPVKLLSPTPVKLSSQEVTIDQARFSVAGGQANIEKVFWSPQNWASHGHFTGIGVHPGSDLIPVEKTLHLGGKWNLQSDASLTKLTGDIEIAREKGDWYLPGELPQPAGLQNLKLFTQARDGRLSAVLDLSSEHAGTVQARIAAPLLASKDGEPFPPHTTLNGHINLNIPDLSWLDHLADGTIQANGNLNVQASIAGTIGKPALQGDIQGQELAIALHEHGLILQQGQLSATFDQAALHIHQLRFVSPHEPAPKDRLLLKLRLEDKPGSLEITGSLGFKDDSHRLAVTLDHLYLFNPPHYWIVVSGNSTIQFVNNVLDVEGELNTNAGLITQPPVTRPQLADDIILAEDKAQQEAESDTDTEQATIVNLHASLDLGRQFFLRVAGLAGRLDGSLRVQNDEDQALSVIGSIATRNTTFKAYGQDLTVERGIVNFHGPIDDPGLNIRAIRKDLEVEAGVEVSGSVRHPRIILVSTPHVPDSEKLSWIVLGRAPDSSGMDTSMLLSAATAILGGQSGGITGQLSEMLGVDEISFRQGAGVSSNPLANQIGTVGKRISSRAYLSYERGITATSAGITKLTYSLTPKITVVTQAGEDSAIDLFYTFRFD